MEKAETLVVALMLTAMISVAAIIIYGRLNVEERLRISTTTSLYDTGLLEAVGNEYEKERSIQLQIISRGTGLAIRLAQDGDVDLILVHAPSKEMSFLTQGYGVCRKIIAYNFFAVVGPENDPAGIRELATFEALSKIVEAGREGQALWVSRGDESGTHAKEKELWEAAGFAWENLRSETSWYVEAGKGMGGTLLLVSERSAYTLSDMGTYLSHSNAGLIALSVLISQGEELLNVYSAIAVNQSRHPHANFGSAIDFVKFLVSDEGQQLVGDYGKDDYGQSLFYPAVKLLAENSDPVANSIREYAFFNGTECPVEYRGGHPELYS